ncbi:MAG TPA: EVE domain-containing protein [Thermoanaerobaculia bacterium]|nr:EVE domain-containing protein [Thermoanaerobaculia bacterium]
MSCWLLKTEPEDYSFTDLERDGRTVWDGVANNQALIHLRNARPGDEALIYHTGDERSAVGLARVVSEPYPDPRSDDPRLAVFDVEVGRRLPRPVTLAEIKADPAFAGFDLVRNSRLSAMPVPPELWRLLLARAGL